jgi:hypothetical protein
MVRISLNEHYEDDIYDTTIKVFKNPSLFISSTTMPDCNQ